MVDLAAVDAGYPVAPDALRAFVGSPESDSAAQNVAARLGMFEHFGGVGETAAV